MEGFSFIVPPGLLLSAIARQRLRFAAWMTKVFLVIVFALAFWTSDMGEVPARQLVKLLLFVGAFSTGALMVSMEVFWWKFDSSGDLKRTFWFVAMLLTLPFGALAYFYAVYLPQTKPQELVEQALTTGAGR